MAGIVYYGFCSLNSVVIKRKKPMLLALTRNLEKALLKRIAERYQVQYNSLNFTIPPKIELG